MGPLFVTVTRAATHVTLETVWCGERRARVFSGFTGPELSRNLARAVADDVAHYVPTEVRLAFEESA